MADQRLKVLCADDNAIIALSMQAAIDDAPDMDCVGCVFRADGLVDEVERTGAGVVLLDLRMPGRDPLEVLSEMKDRHPHVPVIVFSGLGDAETIERAREAGAQGYVSKNGDVDEVLTAIRQIVQGPLHA